MRLSSFWPPRRTLGRLGAELYQRRHPGIPWLSRGAVEVLPDLLRDTDRGLEWGSGDSSVWLSTRLDSMVCVEHDPVWAARVKERLQRRGLNLGSVRLLATEPAARPADSPYVRVIDEFTDGELDVCVVDGEHRAACALSALPKLSPGGLLVLDDAHGYLDHATTSPHSRHGLGPLDSDWASFAQLVKTWRLIWTSDGYSDTAIWIKPNGRRPAAGVD